MPNYNFMPNNRSDFPHVDNVDVYKYDNDFDYSRYDYVQMSLQICTVPWDMGEAHIGNRTISGIGNVVYFETKEKRDAWFDAISDDECYRFETKFKELHRDHVIDVPIPYDMCAKHNYLRVEYNLFANNGSPVQYEGSDGLREWFWFIREVEFVAPNTTRLHLLDDAFQTWIYDVDVTGMILERGHAPMFNVKADEYLSNPIENNTYLLTEDVNYGEASQVAHIDALALNAGTMYACIATTANPTASWADRTPAPSFHNNDGVPSVYVFAVPALGLNGFLSNVDAQVPQFKQTVQGVFFASADLITLNGSFTFAGTTCYNVLAGRKTFDLTDLAKNQFGYSARYADIAKLYTWPYAHIEVTDEYGDVTTVKIEDTTGNIDVNCALSLAFPFVNIDAYLMGMGGNAGASVIFRNIDAKTFDVQGQWYDTLRSWSVPTFALVLDAATEYGYSTKFDRAQMIVDYTTEQANANASADTQIANAALTVSANSATTARSNASAQQSAANAIAFNDDSASAVTTLNTLTAISTIAANEMQGAISAKAGMASSAVSAVGSIASGGVTGAIGAVASVANGIIGAGATMASTNVANGQTSVQASAANVGTRANATYSDTKTTDDTTNQTSTNSDLTAIQNNLTTGTTANSAATQKANAAREATRAQSAIDNSIAQAALREPFTYGSWANGDTAVTRPIGLFSHIVTQSKAAIEAAGDYMLRYGYALDRQWDFNGNWNVGKYFTYWKLRDFWVKNLNVPDMYMDRLRFFLYGGVTVWRKPEDIGNVTIYDNFNG